MNVPLADYPELHYTVSRLVKKIGFSSKIKDQTPILRLLFKMGDPLRYLLARNSSVLHLSSYGFHFAPHFSHVHVLGKNGYMMRPIPMLTKRNTTKKQPNSRWHVTSLEPHEGHRLIIIPIFPSFMLWPPRNGPACYASCGTPPTPSRESPDHASQSRWLAR